MTSSDCGPREADQNLMSTRSDRAQAMSVASASSVGSASNTFKVLLVDDNATVRDSASAYLRDAGYCVTTASNGFEALARVTQNCPDVVLADITMPRLDGYQMCALLKSNTDYRHIPVIMITGRDGLLDQTRAHLVGSGSYVSKPFTAQALTKAVDEVRHLTQEIED